VAHAVQTLTTQVIQGQVEAQRQVAAERAMLDRTVRQLMALAPPDRWPDTPLAHELTVALVALRTTLQLGGQGAPPARREPSPTQRSATTLDQAAPGQAAQHGSTRHNRLTLCKYASYV